MSNKKVIVIGHKNPDTDSICSAVAYSYLKNKISSLKHVPMRAGQLSLETQFVLNKFEVPIPNYISDVSSQISDIEFKHLDSICQDISLRQAWEVMKKNNASTLAVTIYGKLEGIISIRDIATSDMDTLDNRILSKAKTPYKNIAETLNGKVLIGNEEDIFDKGKVIIAAANPDRLETYIEKGDMILLGDRYESQICSLEMEAGCLIICVDAPVTKTIQKMAREAACTIITTPHDTYTVARLINQSMPAKYFMTSENLITFKNDAFISDVKQHMAKVRFRDFPVVDKSGMYVGMISRRFLLDLEKKKVILVDHNEKTQAVDGITDAEILEIIDHHRIGNLETIDPVFFRNQPLGCTATIIYQMYVENNVEIPPNIAGLLCSAIISDTLMFRSPTSTPADKAAAEYLAKVANIDLVKFAEEMFKAGSNLNDKSAEEIFYQDFKKFTAAGKSFGVGQVSAMTAQELDTIEEKLLPYLEDVFKKQNVDMIMFMLTNIMQESSKLIYIGDVAQEVLESAFDTKCTDHSVVLKGMVSRKKQLIPAIMTALQ